MQIKLVKHLTVSILFLLLLAGCSQDSVLHNKELDESINSVVENKDNSEINIQSFINFDWDKAYLITPYTSQEGINDQLGVAFKDPSNIYKRDDIYLLVFLDGEEVAQYVEINRQQTSFSIGEKEHLTPSDAVINIER
ncbi:hypothetical protein [Chengkuizengella axinellae]|uniref:Cyclophilin-like domain-containing protein n=1 Tax=Chengkuizengella axinellae TaxID=3064388 RepID=A0ABT9IXS2_9BACL|nr:hypothetical protein [Chengkuizengella sp. 2205SS18-9]MDP5274122.1 hypothetical protein [Chengkuizengella sp. 2205SS18-9]